MEIKNKMEELMSSELKEIEAGVAGNGTCVCTSGAGETIYVEIPSNPGHNGI